MADLSYQHISQSYETLIQTTGSDQLATALGAMVNTVRADIFTGSFYGGTFQGDGLVISGSAYISGSVSTDWVDFTNGSVIIDAPYKEGRLFYNSDDATLTMYTDNSDVSLQLGQEEWVKVVNKTGGTIPDGTAVRINGAQGNRPTISQSNASLRVGSVVIGLTTHEFLDNEEGYVTVHGTVRGLDTSDYFAGAPLYLQTGSLGELTFPAPPSPNYRTIVGVVTVAHGTQGAIYVQPTIGTSVEDLSDVCSVRTNHGLLVWDETNDIWFSPPDITFSGSLRESPATVVGSTSVGIGTLNPETKLHVWGNISASAFYGDGEFVTGVITSESSSVADYSDTAGTLLGSVESASYAPIDTAYSESVSTRVTTLETNETASFAVSASRALSASIADFYPNAVVDFANITSDPTGYKPDDRINTTISHSNVDRTVYVYPKDGTTFDYYIHGTQYSISTTHSVVHPDVQGEHFFYFDNTETLQTSGFDLETLIQNNAYTANLYWDTGSQTALIVGDEKHGLSMDHSTHGYLHTIFGTQWISGLGIDVFDVDGDGDISSSAQIGISNGVIADEDIRHTITTGDLQTLNPTGSIPILYKTGSTGTWTFKVADEYPIIHRGSSVSYINTNGRVPYNLNTGGNWTLEEVSHVNFVLVHYFATNDIAYNKVIGIQGQDSYANSGDARSGAATEIATIVTSGLPMQEFKALGTVIFQTSNLYDNVPRTRIISTDTGDEYVDFRTSAPIGTGTSVNEHGSLSGLVNDDHKQYILVDGTRDFEGTSSFAVSSSHTLRADIADNAIEYSSSFEIRITTDESNISDLQTDSGSFSTRVMTNETDITNLETDSGSFSTRVTTNETDISNLETDSGSFGTRVTDLENEVSISYADTSVSSSYALSASNAWLADYATLASNSWLADYATSSSYSDYAETASLINGNIHISVPSITQEVNGTTFDFIVGENVSFGDLLYMSGSGQYTIVDTTSTSSMPGVVLATETATIGNECKMLMSGFARNDNWTFETGEVLYASASTISHTAPDAVGSIVQTIGYAVSSSIIQFNPSLVMLEIG